MDHIFKYVKQSFVEFDLFYLCILYWNPITTRKDIIYFYIILVEHKVFCFYWDTL